jgi:hypothetical protein
MSATDDVAVQRGFSRGVGGCAAARVVAMFNSKLRRLVGEQGGESATCATVRGGKCTPTSESVHGRGAALLFFSLVFRILRPRQL